VLERIGAFDERFETGFFEDDDLCVRAREAGFRLLVALNGGVRRPAPSAEPFEDSGRATQAGSSQLRTTDYGLRTTDLHGFPVHDRAK
jgi:hypothetical protein